MGTYFNPNQMYPLVRSTSFTKKYYGNIFVPTLLGSYLNSITSLSGLGYLFSTPSEYLLSIKAFPFDLSLLEKSIQSTSNIYLGIEDTGVEAYIFSLIKPSLNLGTYKIEPIYNSYLDYSPYTKITVYLPYIGFSELDTNEVMGHTLSFDYAIDLDSGEVTCAISNIDNLTYDENDKPDYSGCYVIKTIPGKIAIDLPFGSTNARELQRQMVTSMIGIGTGSVLTVFANEGKGLASSLTKSATGLVNSLQHHYHKGGGAISGLNNLALPQSIYIIREMNSVLVDPKEYKGKPLEMTGTLSDYHGFTSIDSYGSDIDLSFATRDEADEIKSLLQSGVYLP